MYELDKAIIFIQPHKFNERGNARIPFTKIDINPKHFECFEDMEAYILPVFNSPVLNPEDFNVSRIDIAVDKENFPIDILLSILRIKQVRSDSISYYKGTLYIGSDPKIRIYDKVNEIKAKIKKGKQVTRYERDLLESGNRYTRFEVQIRSVKKTLKGVIDDPASFVSYFDRLEFFDFKNNNGSGVLQVLYKYINRKFRSELEKFRDHSIVADIKDKYILSVAEWFKPHAEPF